MKAIALAATFALLAGSPFVASAADTTSNSGTVALACHLTNKHLLICTPVTSESADPRFIGPVEPHDGLLPNGLIANPLTYRASSPEPPLPAELRRWY
jgi:hypothetical protein